MKRILSVFLFFAAFCVLAEDYYINHGYDFATGETLTEKRAGKTSGKLVWQKRGEGYRKLYEKYGIGYPEPLPFFGGGTGYTFEWFKIQTMNRGLKFWRWRYYILRDRPGMCWDGAAQESLFFQILRECEPTEEDAKRIFAETVRLRKSNVDYRVIEEYLQGQYDGLKADEFRAVFSDYLNSPAGAVDRKWEYRREGILRLLMREREKWPVRLSDRFYYDALSSEYTVSLYADFFRFEYGRDPSEFHAALLALSSINSGREEKLFRELTAENRLERFLRQVIPENLPPQPPLLQWRSHREILRRHCRELVERSLAESKE